jgi:hypothetical protein
LDNIWPLEAQKSYFLEYFNLIKKTKLQSLDEFYTNYCPGYYLFQFYKESRTDFSTLRNEKKKKTFETEVLSIIIRKKPLPEKVF